MVEEDIHDHIETEEALTLASIPSTYKTRGKLGTAGAAGVFGYNTAGSGNGRGVFGRVDSGQNDAAGVRGEAANGSTGAAGDGVVGVTDDPGKTGFPNKWAAGVRGLATNTSSDLTAGVYGRNQSSNDGATGVYGITDPSSGATTGVAGVTQGSGDGAAGVAGSGFSKSGRIYGLKGSTQSASNEAAGARGVAKADSGQTYGVHGETTSAGTDAAGVRGEATAGSGTVYGVYGTTNSPSGYGVCSADDAQVKGKLDVTTDVAASGNVSAGNNLDVTGYQDIGEVGATAFLTTNQSVSGGSKTKVQYDDESHDDRNEFDLNNNVFEAASPGDYHVTASVLWDPSGELATASSTFSMYITVNGADPSNDRAKQIGLRGTSGDISKTLRDLNTGDLIGIYVEPSVAATLQGDQYGTYVTVDKIG